MILKREIILLIERKGTDLINKKQADKSLHLYIVGVIRVACKPIQ
jgi:hypothetical protein